MAIVVGAGETEFGESVEAAADGGAGESGLGADLRNGELALFLREGLDDGQAAGERRHEIGVAGERVNLRGRSGRQRRRGLGRDDGGARSFVWCGARSGARH